jgi:hypothetical protein
MTPRIPVEFSTSLIDWNPFVIMVRRRPEIILTRTKTTRRTRIAPTNCRSCASQTKTRA